MTTSSDAIRPQRAAAAKRFIPLALITAFTAVAFAIFNRATPTVTLTAVQIAHDGMVRWSGASTYSNDCTYRESIDIEQGRLLYVDQPLPRGKFNIETGPYPKEALAWLHIHCSGRLQQQFVWPIPQASSTMAIGESEKDTMTARPPVRSLGRRGSGRRGPLTAAMQLLARTTEVVRIQVDLTEHVPTLDKLARNAIPRRVVGEDATFANIAIRSPSWDFNGPRIIYRGTVRYDITAVKVGRIGDIAKALGKEKYKWDIPDCKGQTMPITVDLRFAVSDDQLVVRRGSELARDNTVEYPLGCRYLTLFDSEGIADLSDDLDDALRKLRRDINPLYERVIANFTTHPPLQRYLVDQLERGYLAVTGGMHDGTATIILRSDRTSRLGKGIRPIALRQHGESTIDVSYPFLSNLLTLMVERIEFREWSPASGTGVGDQLVTAMADALGYLNASLGIRVRPTTCYSYPEGHCHSTRGRGLARCASWPAARRNGQW